MAKFKPTSITRKINVGLIQYEGKSLLTEENVEFVLKQFLGLKGRWLDKESINGKYMIKLDEYKREKEEDTENEICFHLVKYDDHLNDIYKLKEDKVVKGISYSKEKTLYETSKVSELDKREVKQRLLIKFIKIKDGSYIGLVLGESSRDFGHYFYMINYFLDSFIKEKKFNISLVFDVKSFESLKKGPIVGLDFNLNLLKQDDYISLYEKLYDVELKDDEALEFIASEKESKNLKYKLKYYFEVDKKVKSGIPNVLNILKSLLKKREKGDITSKGNLKIKVGTKWYEFFNSVLSFNFETNLNTGIYKKIVNNIDNESFFNKIYDKFLMELKLTKKGKLDENELIKKLGLNENYDGEENNKIVDEFLNEI